MNEFKTKLSSVVEDAVIVGIKSTLLKNTIGDIDFSKVGVGQYHCTSDGKFPIEKTSVRVQNSDGSSSPALGMFFAHVIDQNTILIYSQNVVSDNCVSKKHP